MPVTKKKKMLRRAGKKTPAPVLLEEDGSALSASQLADLFRTVEKTVRKYSVGQDSIIRMLLLAVLAQEHAILVGPWGCNKTAVINMVLHLLGEKPFCVTLDKYTPPEALLGMYSTRLLKEHDIWKRNMNGMLPTARFAFIGEVFRGNGAVRASLHTIMNERYVDNGGEHVPVPTHSVFLDSNSYPVRDEDMPFYDRIILRSAVSYLPGNATADFKRMLSQEEFVPAQHTPLCTWGDIADAHAAAMRVDVSTDLHGLLYEIRGGLLANDVVLSDRRYRKAIRVLQASAFLRGATAVGSSDLNALRYVLWRTPKDLDALEATLQAYAGSATVEERDKEMLDAAQEIFDKLIADTQKSANGLDVENATVALSTITDTAQRITDKKMRAKVLTMIADIEQMITGA